MDPSHRYELLNFSAYIKILTLSFYSLFERVMNRSTWWLLFSCPVCLTLCDPMDCSTPGLPVPHHLLRFAQVHVHCFGDAIQPSHPLMPSCSSTLNLSQHQGLFQWASCSHQMTKILEFQLQHQSFQWVFRVDFPWDLLVWSPYCPRDSKKSSPAPQFKGINSLTLHLLYGPPLTTVHDHWEDQGTWCVSTKWYRMVAP